MKIKAYAKVNLTLDICGKREDGYHLLDSVMQSISIFDLISIDKSDEISVKCNENELSGECNIAYKAAVEFFNYVGYYGGTEIFIEKNIPHPAGLGGGSADAAAVICGLNKLYNTSLTLQQLCEIGLKVGADVPFCIVGGTARVQGIGEKITPVKRLPKTYILLVKKGEKTSTKDMYNQIDKTISEKVFYTESAVKAIENNNISELWGNISNSFTAVCGLYGFDEEFQVTKPLAVSLSGSGPTVFALYSDLSSAEYAKKIIESNGTESILAESCDCGISFE